MGSKVGVFISPKVLTREEERWHLSWQDQAGDPTSPAPALWKRGSIEDRDLRVATEDDLLSGSKGMEQRFLGYIRDEGKKMMAVWTDAKAAAPCYFLNQGSEAYLAMDLDGEVFYLGWDRGDQDLCRWYRSLDESHFAVPVRSNRHELCLHIEPGKCQGQTCEAEWRYRRAGGDQWTRPSCGEALAADLGDELYFYLVSPEYLPIDTILRVKLTFSSEENPDIAPYTAKDLVAMGVVESRDWSRTQCVFSPRGCDRSPDGPHEEQLGTDHLYWWGDVVGLKVEGTWDIRAQVLIDGARGWQVCDSDPRICVGPGCGNAPSPGGVTQRAEAILVKS